MKLANILDMEKLITGYESEITQVQTIIVEIKEKFKTLIEKTSNFSIEEKNLSSNIVENQRNEIINNFIGEILNQRNDIYKFNVGFSKPLKTSSINPVNIAIGQNNTIKQSHLDYDDVGRKRFNWKKLIPGVLQKNGNLSTRQLIDLFVQEGIINRDDKKQEACVRSGIKSLESCGIIRQVEKCYGGLWTFVV